MRLNPSTFARNRAISAVLLSLLALLLGIGGTAASTGPGAHTDPSSNGTNETLGAESWHNLLIPSYVPMAPRPPGADPLSCDQPASLPLSGAVCAESMPNTAGNVTLPHALHLRQGGGTGGQTPADPRWVLDQGEATVECRSPSLPLVLLAQSPCYVRLEPGSRLVHPVPDFVRGGRFSLEWVYRALAASDQDSSELSIDLTDADGFVLARHHERVVSSRSAAAAANPNAEAEATTEQNRQFRSLGEEGETTMVSEAQPVDGNLWLYQRLADTSTDQVLGAARHIHVYVPAEAAGPVAVHHTRWTLGRWTPQEQELARDGPAMTTIETRETAAASATVANLGPRADSDANPEEEEEEGWYRGDSLYPYPASKDHHLKENLERAMARMEAVFANHGGQGAGGPGEDSAGSNPNAWLTSLCDIYGGRCVASAATCPNPTEETSIGTSWCESPDLEAEATPSRMCCFSKGSGANASTSSDPVSPTPTPSPSSSPSPSPSASEPHLPDGPNPGHSHRRGPNFPRQHPHPPAPTDGHDGDGDKESGTDIVCQGTGHACRVRSGSCVPVADLEGSQGCGSGLHRNDHLCLGSGCTCCSPFHPIHTRSGPHGGDTGADHHGHDGNDGDSDEDQRCPQTTAPCAAQGGTCKDRHAPCPCWAEEDLCLSATCGCCLPAPPPGSEPTSPSPTPSDGGGGGGNGNGNGNGGGGNGGNGDGNGDGNGNSGGGGGGGIGTGGLVAAILIPLLLLAIGLVLCCCCCLPGGAAGRRRRRLYDDDDEDETGARARNRGWAWRYPNFFTRLGARRFEGPARPSAGVAGAFA